MCESIISEGPDRRGWMFFVKIRTNRAAERTMGATSFRDQVLLTSSDGEGRESPYIDAQFISSSRESRQVATPVPGLLMLMLVNFL